MSNNYYKRTRPEGEFGLIQDAFDTVEGEVRQTELDEKTTPVDADTLSLYDSVAGVLKKLTWANIKATLKTYFDGLYVSKTVVDLTSAVSDYALAVGETAKIDISAASTALNIAVEDGVYELNIVFDVSTFASDQALILQPNNQDHTGEFLFNGTRFDDTIATDEIDVLNGSARDNILLALSSGKPSGLKTTVSIFGDIATCFSKFIGLKSGVMVTMECNTRWDAGTTWTSLGTLSITEAATGIVYVKRTA